MRHRLVPYIFVAGAVTILGLLFRQGFLTDWDSFGYAYLATEARSSNLMLGRWWFVFVMWLSWLFGDVVFRLPPLLAHLPMQLVSLLFAGLAATGMMAWTRRLTTDRTCAVIAGIMVITGPLFLVY